MTAEEAGRHYVQRRIDTYLAAVDQALQTAGIPGDERFSILDDLRAQIADMLNARAGENPSPGDADAVLAEIDTPEAFASAVASALGSTVPAQTAQPPPAPRSRLAGILQKIVQRSLPGHRNPGSRYNKFSSDARRAMSLADREARALNHNYIGTEHILLALALQEGGTAGAILRELGIDPPKIREQIMLAVRPGLAPVTAGKLPHTPRTEDSIDAAVRIAEEAGHTSVCPEHLLLGLLSVPECLAARILTDKLGADPAQIRRQIGL